MDGLQLPLIFSSLLLLLSAVAHCATFTFLNRCGYTVWPGVLSNAGSPSLGTTGFELPAGASRSFQAPNGWSGRFWGRTGCAYDAASERGACATGDCGSGRVECDGAGAAPPVTLAEFTLGGAGGRDFYDVSLVDGYNLPVAVEAAGGGGGCGTTGCPADLNERCPAELRAAGDGGGCKSACEAFGNDEYCCRGLYASPATCRPSAYSQMFKAACPRAYSYAYDDATSTFTCSGADYFVTFCPSSVGSLKSTQDPTTANTATADGGVAATTPPRTTADGGSGVTIGNDDAWLASLATGGATAARGTPPSLLQHVALLAVAVAGVVLLLPPASLAL